MHRAYLSNTAVIRLHVCPSHVPSSKRWITGLSLLSNTNRKPHAGSQTGQSFLVVSPPLGRYFAATTPLYCGMAFT